jgi:hypothetical protein
MRIVHQFAPAMSAMIAGLPGVTSADHVPLENRWNLPIDADVLFVIHGEGDTRAVADAPRPAGWPGTTKLVQIASAGLDDYPTGCSRRRWWPAHPVPIRFPSPNMCWR